MGTDHWNAILIWLTHWGRVTHICVNKLTSIGSDNGLSPGRRQVIIWTNAGILLIGALGTNFNEILIETPSFSLRKTHLKMLSGKWWPFCLGLNVLKERCRYMVPNLHQGLVQFKHNFPSCMDCHYKNKTAVRPSYLYNRNSLLVKWHLEIEITKFAPNMLHGILSAGIKKWGFLTLNFKVILAVLTQNSRKFGLSTL